MFLWRFQLLVGDESHFGMVVLNWIVSLMMSRREIEFLKEIVPPKASSCPAHSAAGYSNIPGIRADGQGIAQVINRIRWDRNSQLSNVEGLHILNYCKEYAFTRIANIWYEDTKTDKIQRIKQMNNAQITGLSLRPASQSTAVSIIKHILFQCKEHRLYRKPLHTGLQEPNNSY